MTTRNLDKLFRPASIALIGASSRPHSVGATLLANLLSGGFKGGIWPVNPKHESLEGKPVYRDVAALPGTPDLAVICTPPASIPQIIRDLASRGTRAAIVLTAGLGKVVDDSGLSVKDAALQAAKPSLMRILGPNCVGMLVPELGINASFAHTNAVAGGLAFVSQSGALVTAILDWAKSRGIGFSKFVSLGDSADVDFGDVIDYLAGDPQTQAILLYIEDIRAARKFMSAARAAARNKPVVILKSGRAPEAAKAAASHTGAVAGQDAVYDAAFRRAGTLRVYSTDDMFDAVEILARGRMADKETLAILTNGGGPGVMATDAVIDGGGQLATLTPETIAALDSQLPDTWSRGNPVDIIGDAPVQRYVAALKVLLDAPEVGSILFIHAPTAIVPSVEIAAALAPLIRESGKPVVSCWLGSGAVARARAIFDQHGLPHYETPEQAVKAHLQLQQFQRNQRLLMEVPSNLIDAQDERAELASSIIRVATAQGRSMLTEVESKQILASYGIPVARGRQVARVEELAAAADELGFPLALKIVSPDISHKSDAGGVVLNIESVDQLLKAARSMVARISAALPQARIEGFSLQQMIIRPHARELLIGVTSDPVFGPVIVFGHGGTAVEVIRDTSSMLPPLNEILARDMIMRTRVARLLKGYRNEPAADLVALERCLIQISHLVADLPEVMELDINPLLADSRGIVALDARIRIGAPVGVGKTGRFAVCPYPDHLTERRLWDGREICLRPIRPEDGQAHQKFFATLDPEDVRYRFFVRMREILPSQLARFTQIDYDREMAFIATCKDNGGETTLGVVRAICDPDRVRAEFAIIVRSDLKGKGLGSVLMEKLLNYLRDLRIYEVTGQALASNASLLGLAHRFGFHVTRQESEECVNLRLVL